MLRTKEFNESYWKMFNAGIIEDDRKPDAMQISIEELDGCRIYRHFFEVKDVKDAKEKIRWLLKNTNCYDVTFWYPHYKAITWYNVNDRDWNYCYNNN